MMLNSQPQSWEGLHATILLEDREILEKLNSGPIFQMLGRPAPTTLTELLTWLETEKFIAKNPAGGGHITNLGAIAAAQNIAEFPSVSRHSVRVIKYKGLDRSEATTETQGHYGYAVGFQGLVGHVMGLLPRSEVIEAALRTSKPIYPEIALREIIANALIHQDFSITGAGPVIEIYGDRIEISNPGKLLPSKKADRLIGTQPESRNEQLASAFRRYRICEERGSGLEKAARECELYGLPPIDFVAGENYFKVSLFSPRTFAEMSARERLNACYQHSILKFLSSSAMTNKSLRERLKMSEKQRSVVSVLIQSAVETGLVKPADPDNKSRKFTEYLPYYA
jgi:ATP-dependent DNA helicase RecG